MSTAVAVGDSAYPDPSAVRDIILRTIRVACARIGFVANCLPGSDHYIRATAWGTRVSIAIANGQLAQADMSPLTAQGTGLITLAGVYGVFPRPAGPAGGQVIIRCTGTVILPKGFQCTAPDGHKYETVAVATLTNGQAVDVIASEAGASTDQGATTQLTWDSAAIGALNPVCTVASGGITAGNDGDVTTNPDGTLNVEPLRQRLIRKLAFPGVGGNWSQVVEWAEEASSSVEAAYAYPAVNGPASYDVALTKAGGDRTLSLANLNLVRAAINSQMPGQNAQNLTGTVPQYVDVTVAASLPLPQTAGGAGGGWREAAPWPAADVKVAAYNGGTGIATVTGTTTPTVGNQIGVWNSGALDTSGNPAPVMLEFSVTSVGGTSGAWTLTVQGGFGFDPTGEYVSAGAVHLVEYAADLLTQIGTLGPGEKSANPDIVPLGKRQPTTDVQSPSALTSRLLALVQDAHSEIADLAYGARYAAGTTTPLTSPSLPLATSDPPNILVLNSLAIHP